MPVYAGEPQSHPPDVQALGVREGQMGNTILVPPGRGMRLSQPVPHSRPEAAACPYLFLLFFGGGWSNICSPTTTLQQFSIRQPLPPTSDDLLFQDELREASGPWGKWVPTPEEKPMAHPYVRLGSSPCLRGEGCHTCTQPVHVGPADLSAHDVTIALECEVTISWSSAYALKMALTCFVSNK